jgi:hypothetical protein
MSTVNCNDPQLRVPRARQWVYKQAKDKLKDLGPDIDTLTPVDVIWRPFGSHSDIIPFDAIGMYSGYLRWCGTIVGLGNSTNIEF